MSLLTISPSTVTAPAPATGKITLTGPAPAGGYVVAVASNSTFATVPATVTVPAGAVSVNFTIATTAPAVQTVVTITGTVNGTSASKQFKILP
jgi:hypothetical protein